MNLRVGTRGSDLALWQTRWVCAALRRLHPDLPIEEVIIKTQGDMLNEHPFGGTWPVGAFVRAIEQALLDGRIDVAVHSFKDLQTAVTAGLVIAAVPAREAVNDVLLTREMVQLDKLPARFKVGTSSPRRSAQFRRLGNVEIVPIRGNVPTRVAKLQRDGAYDGIVMAAAGLRRLGIAHPFWIDLPVDRFLPAPAQGTLAIQARDEKALLDVIAPLNDRATRNAVDAERSFLQAIGAGCHTPVAALATIHGSQIYLRGQLFSDDATRVAEAADSGDDPQSLGAAMAARLVHALKRG